MCFISQLLFSAIKREEAESMQNKMLGVAHSAISNPELTGAGSIGVNLHEIQYIARKPAIRSRIGWKGLYKMGFARLSNGDLLVSPCYIKGLKLETGKPQLMKIDILRSKDDGITWEKVETKGDELVGKEPALQELSDGRLILITSHPHGFRFSTSDDHGVTWKTTLIGPCCGAEEIMKYENGAMEYAVIRNVLEEKDGSLCAWMIKYNTEDWKKYYRKEPGFTQAEDVGSVVCRFVSKDRGSTWEETDRKFNWKKIIGSWIEELQVMRHSDGRLLAFMRTGWSHQIGGIPVRKDIPSACGEESGDHMMLMESSDNGITWGSPRTVTSYGEPHGHLLELSDGRLLCTYASYHLPYGIYAIISNDGGKTWDTEHPVHLASSLTVYVGWPTSVQLPDGDILTAYTITAYEPENDEKTFGVSIKGMTDECVRWQI
jgi:hypothetical protein